MEEQRTIEEKEKPEVESTSTPHDHDSHGDHDEHDGHGPNAINKFGKRAKNFFTAKGNIRWYSFHDIEEAFHLISESWKKHTESYSEDKSGKLAQNLMFWREEVQHRVHETDEGKEQGRAADRKKHYKNFSYKRLIAELADLPAHDKRRAILETLADRGNLRMSNQDLINIVCPREFNQEDWEKADTEIDYTPMREKFKEKIDTVFIGEFNYGKELLEMHNAGFSKAEGNGKSYAGSNEATSTRSEVRSIGNQIKHAPQEGEGTVVGFLTEMVDRANSFSDNGQFADVSIQINGANKEINRSADMGLVGLMITDAFIKEDLSRELMMKIGKSHEQCFRPFATFQEVVGAKMKEGLNGKKVSHFEYWGWINANGITELGATQIINFFNTRNAIAEIKTPTGTTKKIIHMATDSNFRVHSGARITGIEQARKGIGDKFTGYVTKASSMEVFEQATKFRRDTGSATGEIREIAGMIKAGIEDFIDGKRMIDNGEERYFDSFTRDEVDQEGYFLDDFGQRDKKKNENGAIPPQQMEKMGAMRAERGKEIILRILKNMWLYREDREILTKLPTYALYDYNTTDDGAAHGESGGRKESTPLGGTLKVFLEGTLKKWSGTSEYREIMAAYDRLADPSKKLSRAEIEKAKNLRGVDVNSRKDLQKNTSNPADDPDY